MSQTIEPTHEPSMEPTIEVDMFCNSYLCYRATQHMHLSFNKASYNLRLFTKQPSPLVQDQQSSWPHAPRHPEKELPLSSCNNPYRQTTWFESLLVD